MHVLVFIIVGLIAGALAGRVVAGHGYGMVGDIALGVLGALLGGWLFSTFLGVTGGGLLVSIFTAFVGAAVLLYLVRLIAPRRA